MCLRTGCHSLDYIVIPSSVVEIGSDCFSGCENLKEVEFSVFQIKLNSADLAMFKVLQKEKYKKINLKLLIANIMKYIKWGSLSIGNSAFKQCKKLKRIEVSGYAKIDPMAFDNIITKVLIKKWAPPSWY